jgi:hypothetical protein
MNRSNLFIWISIKIVLKIYGKHNLIIYGGLIKRFKNTQLCRCKSKPGSWTLGSKIRSPLTGNNADHATVRASGIEKSVVDGCGSKFHTDLRESNLWSGISKICAYRRNLACFLQFTSSRTVVASRRSFGGAMIASTGSHCNCVDFTVPEINCIVLFSYISILVVCTLLIHTGVQHSAVEYTSANEAVRNVSALAPQFVPVSFCSKLTL